MSIGEWSDKLTKQLENDMRVSEVTVIDDLIQGGYLSSDDWNVINNVNRHKKRVRILVNQLCKSSNPKHAFQAFANCVAKEHKHLVGIVQECMKQFPSVEDLHDNARQPVEHSDDESGEEAGWQHRGKIETADNSNSRLNGIASTNHSCSHGNRNGDYDVVGRRYVSVEKNSNNNKRYEDGGNDSKDTNPERVSVPVVIGKIIHVRDNRDLTAFDEVDGYAEMPPLLPDITATGVYHQNRSAVYIPTRRHSDVCNGNVTLSRTSRYPGDEVDAVLVQPDTHGTHEDRDPKFTSSLECHIHDTHTQADMLCECISAVNRDTGYCARCLQLQTIRKYRRVNDTGYIASSDRATDVTYTNNTTHEIVTGEYRSQIANESRVESRPPSYEYTHQKYNDSVVNTDPNIFLESQKSHDNEHGSENVNTHKFTCNYANCFSNSKCLHNHVYNAHIIVDHDSNPRPYESQCLSNGGHSLVTNHQCVCLNGGYVVKNDSNYINTRRMQKRTHSIECSKQYHDVCNFESSPVMKHNATAQCRPICCPSTNTPNMDTYNMPVIGPESDMKRKNIRPVIMQHCASFGTDINPRGQSSWTSDDEDNTDIVTSDFSANEQVLCNMLHRNITDFSDVVDHLIEDGCLSNDDYRVCHSTSVYRNKAAFLVKCFCDSQNRDGFLKSFKSSLKHVNPALCKWLDSTFSTETNMTTNDAQSERHNIAVENTDTETDINCEANTSLCEHRTYLSKELNDMANCNSVAVENTESESECEANVHASPEDRSTSLCGDDEVDHKVTTISNVYGRRDVVNERLSGIKNHTNCTTSIQTLEESQLLQYRSPFDIMPRGAVPSLKNLDPIFDKFNTMLNAGTLHIDRLPDNPDVQCIVFYLKACDSLYAAKYEEVERFITLSELVVELTSCPDQLRSEIFTNKTWLCLGLGQLGKMEQLLRENEQYLKAHPNAWPLKAKGWFYYDYGRFNKAMMDTAVVFKRRRISREETCLSQGARDLYKQKAIHCCEKAMDYFISSSSSDGPIGAGFSLILMASVYLDCGCIFNNINKQLDNNDIIRSEHLLCICEKLYHDMPLIVKASYLLVIVDLYYRKWQLNFSEPDLLIKAIDRNDENIQLCTQLDVHKELKESTCRQNALSKFLENAQIPHIIQGLIPLSDTS